MTWQLILFLVFDFFFIVITFDVCPVLVQNDYINNLINKLPGNDGKGKDTFFLNFLLTPMHHQSISQYTICCFTELSSSPTWNNNLYLNNQTCDACCGWLFALFAFGLRFSLLHLSCLQAKVSDHLSLGAQPKFRAVVIYEHISFDSCSYWGLVLLKEKQDC